MPPPYPQFNGKPDPWPVGTALSNEEMNARYIARYGQNVGNPAFGSEPPKWIPGYANERFGANGIALVNYWRSLGINRVPTYTEQVDCAFGEKVKNEFYRVFWWLTVEGGTAEQPIHVDSASKPHGPYTELRGPTGYFTYYFNDHAAAVPPPGPPPSPPEPPPAPPTPTEPPAPRLELPAELLAEFAVIASWPVVKPWGMGRTLRAHAAAQVLTAWAKGK